MPDHAHFLTFGLDREADQRKAMQFLRTQSESLLKNYGCKWQKQAHEHVLVDAELEKEALSATIHYILSNPQRKGLVKSSEDWPFLGSILPGYPKVNPFKDNLWKLIELSERWMRQKKVQDG